MEYTLPGDTGLKLSRIGFGCMSLDPARKSESRSLLHEAIEKGVTLFDTADLYNNGANEVLLGEALKNKRDQVILATKVGNQMNPDGKTWRWNPSKPYILQAVDKSLQRLQTDHIDIYQLHGGTLDDPIEETIEAFEQLRSQGKIRQYGISSIRPNVIRQWMERSDLKTLMSQYSLLDQRPAESVFSLAQEHNVGVLVRGSLAQGLLAGKKATIYLSRSLKDVARAASIAEDIDGKHQHRGVAAIQFTLRSPAVASAIVGVRTREHLDTAIEAISSEMNESDYQKMMAAIPPNYYAEHR